MSRSNQIIETPGLRGLLDLVKDEVKTELNCMSIGTIVSFDSSKQTVDVQINYQRVVRQLNSTGPNLYNDVTFSYPVLLKCPLIILNGNGSYVTFPIHSSTPTVPGDNCLVLFCDRNIDNWHETGDTQSPPPSERKHDLSDGVALIGIFSNQKALSDYNQAGIQLNSPFVYLDGNLKVSTGATGSFATVSGQIVIVSDGIIVDIL